MKRSSVFVTPPGGSERTLAAGYASRTEQAGVTGLHNWILRLNSHATAVGSARVCGFTVNP